MLVFVASAPTKRAMSAEKSVRGSRLYFAYGSNLDEQQMEERCFTAAIYGLAYIEGYQFVINGRGVASISEKPQGIVEGVLWTITPSDERLLDWYEGVPSGYYMKDCLMVTDKTSGGMVEALVYISTDSDLGQPRPGYLERIIRAAEHHGLSESYVRALKGWK
jgi:hypothetical protein